MVLIIITKFYSLVLLAFYFTQEILRKNEGIVENSKRNNEENIYIRWDSISFN